jgi:phosphonate transport system substrate-binding protein
MNPEAPHRMKRWCLSLLLCSLAALLPHPAPAQEPAYRFSPVNQFDINLTAAYWNPIIAYVSKKSGYELELKIGRTSADTTAYVLAREVDFVFSNHLFSPERKKMGWKVFGRRWVPELHGAIAVPAGSLIRRLEDLEGQTVAFAGPEAFVGYKVTYAELLHRKIKVNVVFAGNQNSAIEQVIAGKAAAVGSNSTLINGYVRKPINQKTSHGCCMLASLHLICHLWSHKNTWIST